MDREWLAWALLVGYLLSMGVAGAVLTSPWLSMMSGLGAITFTALAMLERGTP